MDYRHQNLPRGIQNNNPFNIIRSTIMWLGKVDWNENTDPHFEQFISAELGIRAGITNVRTLIRRGNNTPTLLFEAYLGYTKVANKEGDPQGYAAFVANEIGIDIDDVIDCTDNTQMKDLAVAIMKQENGSAVIDTMPDSVIQAGLQAAGFFLKH